MKRERKRERDGGGGRWKKGERGWKREKED